MLKGKGFYLWNIPNCEKGDVEQIATLARQAGLTHLLIKVADRFYPHNVSSDGRIDYVPPLADALRQAGIQVWGWHYVYGFEPGPEARMAIQRIQQLDLDGFVIDAEEQYKLPHRDQAARRYMGDLRNRFPDLPMALSSYRFPSLHPQLPWQAFLEHVDMNMPQVYWEKAHNPADQLARTLREFRNLVPQRPVFPTGAAYKGGGWRPTAADAREFLQAVNSANLAGCNFWGWEFCRRDLPEIWEVMCEQAPSAPVPAPTPPNPHMDIAEAYMAALNSHDAAQVLALFNPIALHISGKKIIQGTNALREWYELFFKEIMPDASFIPQGYTGDQQNRHINWKAVCRKGVVKDGSDTLGLFGGKIIYQLSSYHLTAP